ncbi:DNA topoisomerase family protein [Pelagibaculum spongiae]|uniref:DNA topoisomerase type IA zn finger domain-containing protein n=1 Tax=Pelagibaculum spongiae TaxID=2080658 RepID=A0A2V1GZE4_9GAMM|nr:topoisomerase DNA-binding C4 zinc finger domain-containing protein [Pelagibaculum spongiae]PVZ68173.1 hypothetical protein DC094_12795 [Pelagibaculum spongiae]
MKDIPEVCPECAKPLHWRSGAGGHFLGCTGYPECSFLIYPQGGDPELFHQQIDTSSNCPECGGELQVKSGRYGKFIGCANYPQCKHIDSVHKPKETGIACPKCKKGALVERSSRHGKIFWSCSEFPECKYSVWDHPVDQSCPECSWPVMLLKDHKSRGKELVCARKICKYRQAVDLSASEAGEA